MMTPSPLKTTTETNSSCDGFERKLDERFFKKKSTEEKEQKPKPITRADSIVPLFSLIIPKMASESSQSSSPSPSPSPGDTFIGSYISLISKSEIRYEGILYHLNVHDSTLGLKNGTDSKTYCDFSDLDLHVYPRVFVTCLRLCILNLISDFGV